MFEFHIESHISSMEVVMGVSMLLKRFWFCCFKQSAGNGNQIKIPFTANFKYLEILNHTDYL